MNRSSSIGRNSVRAIKSIQRESSSSSVKPPGEHPVPYSVTNVQGARTMFSNIMDSQYITKAKGWAASVGSRAVQAVKDDPKHAVGYVATFGSGYLCRGSGANQTKKVATAAPATVAKDAADAKAAAAKAYEAKDAANAAATTAVMASAAAAASAAAVPQTQMNQESITSSQNLTSDELRPMLGTIGQAIEELRDETRLWREVREEQEQQDMERHNIASPRLSNRHLLKHMHVGADECAYTQVKADVCTADTSPGMALVENIKAEKGPKNLQREDS